MSEALNNIGTIDLYERADWLRDFRNDLTSIMILDGEIVRSSEIKTLQDRFASIPSGRHGDTEVNGENVQISMDDHDRRFKEEMNLHRDKVDRINALVVVLNTSDDILNVKRATNEVLRLIGGKDARLLYPEPEADPNLLEL